MKVKIATWLSVHLIVLLSLGVAVSFAAKTMKDKNGNVFTVRSELQSTQPPGRAGVVTCDKIENNTAVLCYNSRPYDCFLINQNSLTVSNWVVVRQPVSNWENELSQ